MRNVIPPFALLLSAGVVLPTLVPARLTRSVARSHTDGVVANDNRTPAGVLSNGVLTLRLEARVAMWHPDADSAEGAEVPAFAERGKTALIPGPLIRVPAGTELSVMVTNSLRDPLAMHGLHARPMESTAPEAADSIAPGATGNYHFRLDTPGTYYYWGTTSGRALDYRTGIDAQLSGAIVVDDAGARPAVDRVFVIGVWADTVGRALAPRKRVLAVVNGRSWPHTERLSYTVGDTVHWRVINASADSHPMHLHGFYFRVDGRGDWQADTVYGETRRRMANTELLAPGALMTMTWVPERAGNWLFHCHLPEHFTARGSLGRGRPAPSTHAHGPVNHALDDMNGLVLGVHVGQRGSDDLAAESTADTARRRALRLVVRRNAGGDDSAPFYSFALQTGATAPPLDTGLRVGPPIVLTRGEPVGITVVNTLDVPTAVHWHGIELTSYFDGVAGFSGSGPRITPVIAPGDSFEARFTPPRAGTFIYHTHVDETRQQLAGLSGPLIVVERGSTFDSMTDHPVLITSPPRLEDEGRGVLLNGSMTPVPLVLRAGVAHRIRFINITARRPGIRMELRRDTTLAMWRTVGKDGAELPSWRRGLSPATVPISIGETVDVELVPGALGNLVLRVVAATGVVLTTMPVRVQP